MKLLRTSEDLYFHENLSLESLSYMVLHAYDVIIVQGQIQKRGLFLLLLVSHTLNQTSSFLKRGALQSFRTLGEPPRSAPGCTSLIGGLPTGLVM